MGGSKAECVRRTIRDLVSFLDAQGGSDHSLRIHSFDHSVSARLSAPSVRNMGKGVLEAAVSELAPRGGANIELALREAKRVVDTIVLPVGERVVHLLLTDGLPTHGETDLDKLTSLGPVGPHIRNACLGYGGGDCARMLGALGRSGVDWSCGAGDSPEDARRICAHLADNSDPSPKTLS